MPISVLDLPQYSVHLIPAPCNVVGSNGPIRLHISQLDGSDVPVPASAIITVIDPDGNSTNPAPTVESIDPSTDIYLDVRYLFALVGIHRIEAIITMPDTTVIGAKGSINSTSY